MSEHETDTGERCDRHVGEVFPVRCIDCERLRRARGPRIGYVPGTECARHAGYPLPCARCSREAEEAADVLRATVHRVDTAQTGHSASGIRHWMPDQTPGGSLMATETVKRSPVDQANERIEVREAVSEVASNGPPATWVLHHTGNLAVSRVDGSDAISFGDEFVVDHPETVARAG
jgi:hypothetical protein